MSGIKLLPAVPFEGANTFGIIVVRGSNELIGGQHRAAMIIAERGGIPENWIVWVDPATSVKPNIKAVVIRGDFTEVEFAEIVALLRRIDQARPDGHFDIEVIDPTSELDIAERVIRDALPPLPDRDTQFITIKQGR